MAQCKHVNPETGERCGADAQVLGDGAGWCCWHDPFRSDEEKRGWARKGGRASKKVEPADVPELRQLLADLEDGTNDDDIVQVKRILVRSMRDLLSGHLSPTQFRALTSSGIGTLKDIIALDYYRQLVERVERLEGGGEPLRLEGGDEWQVSRSDR